MAIAKVLIYGWIDPIQSMLHRSFAERHVESRRVSAAKGLVANTRCQTSRCAYSDCRFNFWTILPCGLMLGVFAPLSIVVTANELLDQREWQAVRLTQE